MKKILFLLLIIFASIETTKAQWVSPGNGTTYTLNDLAEISNGTVTQEDTGHYKILGDLTISTNDILSIDNSVLSISIDSVLLTIQGTMTCNNIEQEILITNLNDNHYRIRFEDAIDNELNNLHFNNGGGIQVIESEIEFNHCEFNNFTADISACIDYHNCNPIITECNFHDNAGSAISSGVNITGSPKIENCIFDNNVTLNTNRPQINLGPGAEDTIYIVNNQIIGHESDMSGGISIADIVNVGSTKIMIKGNIIKNNRYGINQQGYTINSVICDNYIIDNNLETNPMNGGSGISIYGMNENCSATIRNNIISGNLWGITAIYYHHIDLGTNDDWGGNVFYDNGNNGSTYALYNNAYSDISAIGNYWGDNNENFAESVIFHKPDQADLGLVTYSPVNELYPDITEFVFKKEFNPSLSQSVYGQIDEITHIINVDFEESVDVTNLKMTYLKRLGVTGDPESGTTLDFTDPVTITLTTPHGTSQEWIVNVTSCNATAEEFDSKFVIAPNPVINGSLIINNNFNHTANIDIINLLGQVVYTGIIENQIHVVDVSNLENGIYLVKIKTNDRNLTKKLIIK